MFCAAAACLRSSARPGWTVLGDRCEYKTHLSIECLPQGVEDHCQGLKRRRQGQVTCERGTLNPFHPSDASQTALKSPVIDNVSLQHYTEINKQYNSWCYHFVCTSSVKFALTCCTASQNHRKDLVSNKKN